MFCLLFIYVFIRSFLFVVLHQVCNNKFTTTICLIYSAHFPPASRTFIHLLIYLFIYLLILLLPQTVCTDSSQRVSVAYRHSQRHLHLDRRRQGIFFKKKWIVRPDFFKKKYMYMWVHVRSSRGFDFFFFFFFEIFFTWYIIHTWCTLTTSKVGLFFFFVVGSALDIQI